MRIGTAIWRAASPRTCAGAGGSGRVRRWRCTAGRGCGAEAVAASGRAVGFPDCDPITTASTAAAAAITTPTAVTRWARRLCGAMARAYPRRVSASAPGIIAALDVLFWIAVGLLVYTHVGYPLLLAALARTRRSPAWRGVAPPPRVTLVIAAFNEGPVIARRVENARALDYPDLAVIVASA